MESSITAINEKVRKESGFCQAILFELEKVIIGQKYLLERFLVGLLANGHILSAGHEIMVLRTEGVWAKIRRGDGKEGWVEAANIERI